MRYWLVVGPRCTYATASDDVRSAVAFGVHLKTFGMPVTACGLRTTSWKVYWQAQVHAPEVCPRCRLVATTNPCPEPSPERCEVSSAEVARRLGMSVNAVALAMRGGLTRAPKTRALILRTVDAMQREYNSGSTNPPRRTA